ncbi:putative metallothionein, partial [Hyalella azteca]
MPGPCYARQMATAAGGCKQVLWRRFSSCQPYHYSTSCVRWCKRRTNCARWCKRRTNCV